MVAGKKPEMAEDAPPPPEDATLKRKDPPVEDDDSDEEEAAARARRPRGARSAVRPGVECPYMDTISRQVRAVCVCVWSVCLTPLTRGDPRGVPPSLAFPPSASPLSRAVAPVPPAALPRAFVRVAWGGPL